MKANPIRAPVIVLLTSLLAVSLLFSGESNLVANIAKLEAELEEGKVSEWTVREVAFSCDRQAMGVLLAVLASPESTRHRGIGTGQFELAARGLGWIGDSGAIPGLRRFLQSRLGADTLAADDLPFGGLGPTGRVVNLHRSNEALYAALSLYALGDWRAALGALDALVQDESTSSVHHLHLAAQLDVKRYGGNGEASDSIVAYLRRACDSPFLDVRAQGALSLADRDPGLAYQTAASVIATGPDEDVYRGHHKRTAVSALAAIGDAKSLELLKELAHTGEPFVRGEAQQALARLEGREP